MSYIADHYGDIASVVGLLVSLVGFIITIWNVRRTRKAAEEAVFRFRSILLADDLAATLHLLEEIESDCRERRWAIAELHAGQARTRLSGFIDHPEISLIERPSLLELIRDLLETRQELRRIVVSKAATPKLDPMVPERLHQGIVFLSRLKMRQQSKSAEK